MSGIAGSARSSACWRAESTGAQDAQERLLRSIDAKVDALVKGPYNTGRTHLREAQRIGALDPNHLRHIEQANECFYTARWTGSVGAEPPCSVEYHLGLTWLLLGRRDDGVHWLAQITARPLPSSTSWRGKP